tara:strand:- start:21 stop:428 length:408 start_codon:yes stop_codon:yes gene_type:complete
MESRGIRYKFKKLSPMNIKKLNKNIQNYFIKLDKNWYNLIDLYESLNTSKINPQTNEPFKQKEIQKILKLYKELIEVEPKFNSNNENNGNNEKLLTDYIDLFESQLTELYSKQEEIYALTQIHHHEIEEINKKLS